MFQLSKVRGYKKKASRFSFQWLPSKIDIYNRFEILSELESPDQGIDRNEFNEVKFEVDVEEKFYLLKIFPESISEIFAKERRKTGSGLNKSKVRPMSDKMKNISLKEFESTNLVGSLEEKTEEDIMRLSILKMRKFLIKKCKSCNFKKRSCMLDRLSCPSLQKICCACNKKGHFPKSLNCKSSRITKRRNKPNTNFQIQHKICSKQILEQHLKLIKEKISQLEPCSGEEVLVLSGKKKTEERSYLDLIPFIMMYIFLNYQCFNSNIGWGKTFYSLKDEIKKAELKITILNVAKVCTRKNNHFSNEKDKMNFLKYCSKKVQKILNLKLTPNKDEIVSIQSKVDAFEKMFYFDQEIDHSPQIPDCDVDLSDDTESVLSQNLSIHDYIIPQMDGQITESSEDEVKKKKSIFSVNIGLNEITQLISFFRSFDNVWNSLDFHKICAQNHLLESCFFCYMRSSCLRLNAVRRLGPKTLKINEFTSQLNQYQTVLGWNWHDHASNLPIFIQKTLSLLKVYESKIPSQFGLLNHQCEKCLENQRFPEQIIHQLDTSNSLSEQVNLNVKCLVEVLMKKNALNKCCLESNIYSSKKIALVEFSHPIFLDLTSSNEIYGHKLIINSFVSEENVDGVASYCSTFYLNNRAYYQDEEGNICESETINKKIKLISFMILNREEELISNDIETFKFDAKLLKQLYRKCSSILTPTKFAKRKQIEADYELHRSGDEARKKYKQSIDKVRNKTEKRKAMERLRDKTEERKKMHHNIDQKRNKNPKRKSQLSEYEKTETRRFYVNTRNRLRYRKKLYDTFTTDTGFDVICSSCLQYKSLQYCKLVSTLSKDKIKKFIVQKNNLLKNRSDNQHVCNLCFEDIKQNKVPKRSHKNRFKFANFPNNFIQKVKQKCAFKEQNVSDGCVLSNVNYDREYLKLNRLESYLLKLVIPFIRIAHCPRGRYFKVLGDLILISSDISHSLIQILPLQQSLIPVSFKRKLSYSGSYIEEYIEKEKIQMYFSWLKENNHLYKDMQFDTSIIDKFEQESKSLSREFESRTKESNLNTSTFPTGSSETVIEEDDVSAFIDNQFETYQSVEDVQENRKHDQTTMFMNKYCEDQNIPSIANKMADMIVTYEMAQKMIVENDCDFEVDDEIVNEEEFLRLIDAEMDEPSTSHTPVDQENRNMDSMSTPTVDQMHLITEKANNQASKILDKMEKIAVAPGQFGGFQNWGKDVFLEEKCFPEKFPYGTGGYLSSCIDDEGNGMGFANYCINQLMSADPKFRQDSAYLFFLLLVKELIQLKRCKSTYFRQATRLPNLNKENIVNIDRSNLSRYNRSYQVFKSMRGTSMYYEESKKNLMALLRQNGCPSVFLTLSCAEFDWPELLKEIVETVERRKVSKEYIENMSQSARNKIISENVVQSTVHFQKRMDKLFSLMKDDFFDGSNDAYHVSTYFYRIEFQQRGAPHLHSLLWLKNKVGDEAPSFWIDKKNQGIDSPQQMEEDNQRMKKVESFADFLISTSPEDIRCSNHKSKSGDQDLTCEECQLLMEKVKKYQSHSHTFTCAKKMKTLTIMENEGHGRLDGTVKGLQLSNIPVCRFRFPKFPLDETSLIRGMSKDTDEQIIKGRKEDLNKVIKFLLRQTHTERNLEDSNGWKKLKDLSFWQFLYEAGMFRVNKPIDQFSEIERNEARSRYLDAISASVRGTAIVMMKRKVKDIFVNGYNASIMRLHKANHDLQICIDQYSCAQYICGYLTKNESGISKLLKTVNDECNNMAEIDKLNALASVLDKHREVSIQESIYRLLSLPMSKSSVKVKYLSTIHPHFRDGLLKGNVEELAEDESVFHNSPHQYYEQRPEQSNEPDVDYDPEELEEDYWINLSLAEFWSKYEIVYNKNAKKILKNEKKTKVQTLKSKKGFIRKRLEPAVLRYYLNYSNDEDLARGLLILFKPFRNEMDDIHKHDVKKLLAESNELIADKRKMFEKYQVMCDLIANISKEIDERGDANITEEDDTLEETETTDLQDINDFTKWARSQASKELSTMKDLTDVCDPTKLRSSISTLNEQQRRLFDDFTERMVSSDLDEKPVYLFVAGNAGTGKSFLVNILIEAVKLIKIKAGDDLKKPPVIVMAPTANAAYIIGGRTIDSVLGFNPTDTNRYTQTEAGRLAMMKFQYEDVQAIFCDEISMVGSMKLSKINFRLQDIADGAKKKEFMGGISFVASGIFDILFDLLDSLKY